LNSVAGKTVLVTGGAKRIGRAIALRLFHEGARVLIHYGTSEQEALETAAECGEAPLFRANLESVAEIRAMFEQIGHLDGLVNNAARFTRMDVMAIEEADWDFIHSVNLKSVFFCCQAAARLMRAGGSGSIVNISSLGGLRPWADHAHYCASKAGVIMLTKALAKALAPEINVNSVAPGVFPFGDRDAGETQPEVQAMIRRTPMRRAGEADELADAVLYFLSAPKFVTGQVLAVDGGLSLA
jgi:NAD(P)-dependent dehydrogenase (short-subunit alcohol dehydrogenase family)